MTNYFIKSVLIGVVSAAMFATSCRPVKKIQNVVNTADTAKVIVLPKPSDGADSMTINQEIHNKVAATKIDFRFFNGKAKVDFIDGKGKKTDATLHIRMQKDSIIWLSLTGALSIEGFRILVKPDSVSIMNKLDKEISYKSMEYLQELIQLPVDFYTLQDLLIGNPVFLPETFSSVRYGEKYLHAVGKTTFFKSLIAINKANNLIANMKLDDVIDTRSRTCDITYDNYQALPDSIMFSAKREINVSEKSKISVKLDFKQNTFNEPQTFPFIVPKNYKLIP